jgi:hypothetical protein
LNTPGGNAGLAAEGEASLLDRAAAKNFNNYSQLAGRPGDCDNAGSRLPSDARPGQRYASGLKHVSLISISSLQLTPSSRQFSVFAPDKLVVIWDLFPLEDASVHAGFNWYLRLCSREEYFTEEIL